MDLIDYRKVGFSAMTQPIHKGCSPALRERRSLVVERDVSDIHMIVEKLSTEIPGARKQGVVGASHLVPMEKPAQFNSLVTEFLQGLKHT